MLLCQLGAGASAAGQGRRGVARPPSPLAHHPRSGNGCSSRHTQGEVGGSSPVHCHLRDWHAPHPWGRKRIMGSRISHCFSIYPQH